MHQQSLHEESFQSDDSGWTQKQFNNNQQRQESPHDRSNFIENRTLADLSSPARISGTKQDPASSTLSHTEIRDRAMSDVEIECLEGSMQVPRDEVLINATDAGQPESKYTIAWARDTSINPFSNKNSLFQKPRQFFFSSPGKNTSPNWTKSKFTKFVSQLGERLQKDDNNEISDDDQSVFVMSRESEEEINRASPTSFQHPKSRIPEWFASIADSVVVWVRTATMFSQSVSSYHTLRASFIFLFFTSIAISLVTSYALYSSLQLEIYALSWFFLQSLPRLIKVWHGGDIAPDSNFYPDWLMINLERISFYFEWFELKILFGMEYYGRLDIVQVESRIRGDIIHEDSSDPEDNNNKHWAPESHLVWMKIPSLNSYPRNECESTLAHHNTLEYIIRHAQSWRLNKNGEYLLENKSFRRTPGLLTMLSKIYLERTYKKLGHDPCMKLNFERELKETDNSPRRGISGQRSIPARSTGRKKKSSMQKRHRRAASFEVNLSKHEEESHEMFGRQRGGSSDSDTSCSSIPRSKSSLLKVSDRNLDEEDAFLSSSTYGEGDESEYHKHFLTLKKFSQNDISDLKRSDSDESLSTVTSSLVSSGKRSKPEVNWIDVGARLGIRLLGTENLINNLVADETEATSTVLDTGAKKGILCDNGTVILDGKVASPRTSEKLKLQSGKSTAHILPPVHSMWTSPSAAASRLVSNSFAKPNVIEQGAPSIGNATTMKEKENTTPLRTRSASCNSSPITSRFNRRDSTSSPSGPFTSPPKPSRHSWEDSEDSNISDNSSLSPSQIAIFDSSEKPVQSRDASLETISPVKFIDRSPALERLHQSHPNFDVSSPMSRKGRRASACLEKNGHSFSPRSRDQGFEVALFGSSKKDSPKRSNYVAPKRNILSQGVKMVIPIFPDVSFAGLKPKPKAVPGYLQMGTIASCRRIFLAPCESQESSGYNLLPSPSRIISLPSGGERLETNCLEIKLALDKSYLRKGKFAQMTIRVHDGSEQFPPHSKFPIGSCVATSFGLGVLVGWRVEDDCHVIRSLWQRRGPGSACAYLHRDSIHGIVEAACGFKVLTPLGKGEVLGYVNAGRDFMRGRFFVAIKSRLRYSHAMESTHIIGFGRSDILSCPSVKFIPILEQIREAANYQIQIEEYKAAVRAVQTGGADDDWLPVWVGAIEKAISCVFRAVDEDPHFDKEMNTFVASAIRLLEQFDVITDTSGELVEKETNETLLQPKKSADNVQSATWLFDEVMGQLFGNVGVLHPEIKSPRSLSESSVVSEWSEKVDINWPAAMGVGDTNRPFGVIRTLTRALTIARVETESDNMRMLFSSGIEFLLLTRAILKVRKMNVSQQTLANRKRTLKLLTSTFSPIRARLISFGETLMRRIEKKGRRAKVRFARFIDILVRDDAFMTAVEKGDWDVCISQVECAVVKARILDAQTCAQVRESALIIYGALAPTQKKAPKAESKEGGSFVSIAKIMKWIAAPRRTLLQLLKRDDILDLLERVLVRCFGNKEEETQMLNIYAFNFHSFRQMMVLKNMAVASSLWLQLAETAHNEFTWFVSRFPDNHLRELGTQLAQLFGLGILHMRSIFSGRADAADWLDFLMEANAIQIIQEMDQKIVSVVEEVCNDIKSTLDVMPYYAR